MPVLDEFLRLCQQGKMKREEISFLPLAFEIQLSPKTRLKIVSTCLV